MRQQPEPGARLIMHQGDMLEVTLELSRPAKGAAWLRTNIGHAEIRHREIVQHVENNAPILAHDWQDLRMRKTDDTHYCMAVPLTEVGRFETKSFFLPEKSDVPVWPAGRNIMTKVEPAEYCCANTIYSAFVRQFGPNRCAWSTSRGDNIRALEESGYSVIPRSGTFRDLIRELDFIIGTLRHRIVQLLPIHPIPTTYARMGRFGSPFAVLDFMDVDPALSEFDRRTTPLEQFDELVNAVHARNGHIFIDIPINHTGWASKLQIEHPEWFARGSDRTFQSPGAWGVTWEDLAKLDYSHRDLWKYMANVFLFWCRRGVDGFRCDAGYMVPYPVWEYIAAKVRLEYPETIFMLEGLGGKIETLTRLLADANLDWGYSELFQNYDRTQIETYLPQAVSLSNTAGLLVHFAETHDNNRLAATSHVYARMRTALSALLSQDGAFGITNGLEWFAEEKIDVHDSPPLNWGNETNMADLVARLNAITEAHPCFHPGSRLRLVEQGNSNIIVLARESKDGAHALTIVANLDHRQDCEAAWQTDHGPAARAGVVDLLTDRPAPVHTDGIVASCRLEPGQVLCLSADRSFTAILSGMLDGLPSLPQRTLRQRLRAKALEVQEYYSVDAGPRNIQADALADALSASPSEFCAEAAGHEAFPVAEWRYPTDAGRLLMVPPGRFLYISCEHPFAVTLRHGNALGRHERSLPQDDGRHFALLKPPPATASMRCPLELKLYDSKKTIVCRANLLYLSDTRHAEARRSFTGAEAERFDCYALCTNGSGAMAQVRSAWAEIRSQYDAILAANLDPDRPVDRHIMLTRCRAWIVSRGYSQPLDRTCLDAFTVHPDGSAEWEFTVPAGQGKVMPLSTHLRMIPDENAVAIRFHRKSANDDPAQLTDDTAVRLVVRPDIEDRVNHHKTKAFSGPEQSWPAALAPHGTGFAFTPHPTRRLLVTASSGAYSSEPEWTYMVHHPVEAGRGLDASSDLFSPGYFTFQMKGAESHTLHASVGPADRPAQSEPTPEPIPEPAPRPAPRGVPLRDALLTAIRQFIVRRDNCKTVIAGYPWFLDWGRDTLICARGIIAAGMIPEAREILRRFAQFEEHGTLPNMIRGGDASDRDTSDAPLWFFVACNDLVQTGRADDFLQQTCGTRTIHEVLVSIASNYISGTQNGITVDPESGLVFSPAHFTWMDTNHPAGTPRRGYPIEIQALWHFALRFLAHLEPAGNWRRLASRVQRSIVKHFVQHRDTHAASAIQNPQSTFLSDCLHASHGQPAAAATADDHLRPNQLLAVTLGAVDDRRICAGVLDACSELLVPGAIRSLADRPTAFELPIRRHDRALNNPARPYWGRYEGDEDTRRKPAYHNGTAWTWQFPSFCEALLQVYGPGAAPTARAILLSSVELINRGCVGQIPEITDGDFPHSQRGCGAQAWGATELYRVLAILDGQE